MVLVSYDISDDKKRNRFCRYLKKYGNRLQYSVFQIYNSNRVLNNIIEDLNNKYSKEFDEEDSVMIFKMSSSCDIIKFGYCKNEDTDLLVVK